MTCLASTSSGPGQSPTAHENLLMRCSVMNVNLPGRRMFKNNRAINCISYPQHTDQEVSKLHIVGYHSTFRMSFWTWGRAVTQLCFCLYADLAGIWLMIDISYLSSTVENGLISPSPPGNSVFCSHHCVPPCVTSEMFSLLVDRCSQSPSWSPSLAFTYGCPYWDFGLKTVWVVPHMGPRVPFAPALLSELFTTYISFFWFVTIQLYILNKVKTLQDWTLLTGVMINWQILEDPFDAEGAETFGTF